MKHEPTQCKGGCGKSLRPKRATREQFPGTVRAEAWDRCQPCYIALKEQGMTLKERKAGKCKRCDRPTRPRGARIEDYPGTVGEYGANKCLTCWKHEKYGPPKGHQREHSDWGECTSCERPMRPHNATKAEAPGTVKHHARGVCTTCHRRELNPGLVDRPMIVGRVPASAVVESVEPEPVVEVTDPGLLRLRAERNERRRRQEQAQRIRAEQEAVQRRFIARRKAAA